MRSKNGANGPTSLSDLGKDATSVTIDAINSTSATTLAWADDATDPLSVEIAKAESTAAAANLKIDAKASELSLKADGQVVLASDSSVMDTLANLTTAGGSYDLTLGTVEVIS